MNVRARADSGVVTSGGPGADRRDGLATLGPFFAVQSHDAGSAPDAGWRPFSDLVDVPEVLRTRVDAARAVLAAGRPIETIEIRVAASVVHLGLAARLLSPLLALAALHDLDHVPALSDIRWRDTLGGVVPLSLPHPLLEGPAPAHPDWDRWATDLVAGPLADVSRAVAALTPSAHTRRGNIASAVHGAVTVLSNAVPDRRAAGPAERSRTLGRLLLDRPELRAAAGGEPGTSAFRRRNCCLIYRAAEPARPATIRTARPICGDCVLTAP